MRHLDSAEMLSAMLCKRIAFGKKYTQHKHRDPYSS